MLCSPHFFRVPHPFNALSLRRSCARKPYPSDYLSPYPKLNSVVEAVGAIPAINKYYVAAAAQDPKYKFFAGEK